MDSVDAVHPVDRQSQSSIDEVSVNLEKKIEENNVMIVKITNTLEEFNNKLSKLDILNQDIKSISNLKQRFVDNDDKYQKLASKYKKTYILKYIFLLAFLIILSLQPLWLLIHLNKFF